LASREQARPATLFIVVAHAAPPPSRRGFRRPLRLPPSALLCRSTALRATAHGIERPPFVDFGPVATRSRAMPRNIVGPRSRSAVSSAALLISASVYV